MSGFACVAAWQVENTAGDSFDLYYGLFMYNTNATEQVCGLDRCQVQLG